MFSWIVAAWRCQHSYLTQFRGKERVMFSEFWIFFGLKKWNECISCLLPLTSPLKTDVSVISTEHEWHGIGQSCHHFPEKKLSNFKLHMGFQLYLWTLSHHLTEPFLAWSETFTVSTLDRFGKIWLQTVLDWEISAWLSNLSVAEKAQQALLFCQVLDSKTSCWP